MKLETWLSIASLGLSIMFISLIISLYTFLVGPEGQGPERVVDPGGLIIQQVSISGAPGVILAGITFVLARSYGNKLAAVILIGSGVIIISGMVVASNILPSIPAQYRTSGIPFVPYMFMAAGAGVLGIGGMLLTISSRPRTTSHLDDLR
ncbi:MAG: hypothetical protein DA330_08465 [Nitrososphaera sp.]|nr:hypothetical protein [Nitrososphaera sp.]